MSLLINTVGVPIAGRFRGVWQQVYTEDGKKRGFTYLCLDTHDLVYRVTADSKNDFLHHNTDIMVYIDAEVWDTIKHSMKVDRVEVYDIRHNVLFSLPKKKFEMCRKALKRGDRAVYGVAMEEWIAYDGSPIYAPIGAAKWRV